MLRKTINEMPVLSGRLIRDSARPRSSAVGVLKNHGFPGGCTQGASVTTLAPTLIEHLDFLHHAAHLRSRTRLGIFSACSRAAMEGMYSTRGSSCAPRPNTCATATTVKNEVFPLAPGCCGWMPPPRSAGPARLGLRIAARYAVRLQPGTEHIALGGY